jgi:NADPH2:quinone reductase
MSADGRVVRTHTVRELGAYAIERDPLPVPRPGEVRLRVRACGVGYVDALHATGRYQLAATVPFTPGVEVAGEIDAMGPEVAGLSIGLRVIPLMSVRGGFADYVVAPAAQIAAIPDGMTFAEAAAIRANTLTAMHALVDRGRIEAGETVLVIGAAGGVGSAAVQLAKRLGARVVATASSEAKRAFARRLGADVAIDTDPEGWRDRLMEACGGGGPDIVVDPVCGPLFEPAFRSLAWNGRHLVIGFAGGPIPSLKANLPLLKGAMLVGVDVRQFNLKQPERADANRARLRAWLAEGSVGAPVGATFPFERFREALDHAASGAGPGKTVLLVD